MSSFRRDQIPVVVSAFMNFVWAFSSFLSVDMVKLYSYYFMHQINFPTLYYTVFAFSFICFTFLKFNRVFTTVVIIWFNFLVHLLLVFFIYFPIKNRIFYRLLFAFWSHLFALNLIATLYLASYNIGGINGLVMGAASAYFFGYLLLHGVERPSDFSIASRKTTCNWFISVRCFFSIVSFIFYRDYLEYYFYFEYNDSVNRVTMENLFKWFDGQEVDLMTTVRINDLMPTHINLGCLKYLLAPSLAPAAYLAVIYMSFCTTSMFSPPFNPTPIVSSIYFRDDIYFIEYLGGFLGALIAVLLRPHLHKRFASLFLIHYLISGFLFFGFNTYKLDLYNKKIVLSLLSFFSSILGTFVLVFAFINFLSGNLTFKCKKRSPSCQECCVNDTGICLCNKKNSNEPCSKPPPTECVNIWLPYNNHNTFRDWTYGDCIFCHSQNYKNKKANCTCCAGAQTNCCACCCPSCVTRSPCSCSPCSQRCSQRCCCKTNKTRHYLLRNCVVSCCPYCDYCLLLECVKIPCVCPCKHRTCKNRNEVQNTTLGDKKNCLAKIKLNIGKDQKHFYLCSYSDAPDLEKLKKLFCCKNQDASQNCCIKCCGDNENICGKHFTIADHKISSCCHYQLKIWISLKEINSTFHIGQQPFDKKYEQINSLIFANDKCKECCKNCGCSEGTNCKQVDILKINEKDNQSECGGYLKMECKGSNGVCKCCCCCCQSTGDSSQCECCCGSCPQATTCQNKKCCAMKILPTNLPYHFRKIDIRRNEVIALVCFSVLIFCLVKLIASMVISYKMKEYYLPISFKVSDFTEVQKVNFKKYEFKEYKSDSQYARKVFPDYEGDEKYLIKYALDVEIQLLERKTNLIRDFMDELNTLRFDNWCEDMIKNQKKRITGPYSELKFYAHFNAYLDYALKYLVFRDADLIFYYFKKYTQQWEVEWNDFEKRFLRNLKIYTDYSLSLNSVGYFDTNTELQKIIDNRQLSILKFLNSRNDQLTGYLSMNRDLLEKLKRSSKEEKLPRHIDLWEFRLSLIREWSADRSILLNWNPFEYSMDMILLWNDLFRDLYIQSFVSTYRNNKHQDVNI
ncbi:putative integral membrane protein [Theileria parva strain Muguga]|uniref:putative integral membrane protein n=1 Tax=Theileria parva strain Muguga TaxID=333668 RepID=UPI001C6175CD|nr:putative integral membrane protein [Theileria parva strain Muguga]KAF5153449.1 putative integral membrane protein [Theileria parva strain Muguga]